MLLDLPPRPPPDSEQPPPLQGRVSKAGIALKGVATTIEDLNTALSLADQNGMSVEEKRKLKKKVRGPCLVFSIEPHRPFRSRSGLTLSCGPKATDNTQKMLLEC